MEDNHHTSGYFFKILMFNDAFLRTTI